ncbi:MAG: rSAM/selenodomain-associated transferase 1 [Candidatus Endobugula sp.]|jgi:rSAM/selenodomain-associated transferase 1
MSYTLLVMSKSPELGRVKTRMQPHLTQSQSLQLHIMLAQHVLPIWSNVKSLSMELWIGGDIESFKQKVIFPLSDATLLNNDFSNVAIYSQPQGDLGSRMAHAVRSAFSRGILGVFLVGTDCPFIDENYLLQAIQQLEKNDVVLGPANDGGYVLMGLKKYHPALFDNISWGTSTVLEDTKRAINEVAFSSHLLSSLSDIDVPDDLHLLAKKISFPNHY